MKRKGIIFGRVGKNILLKVYDYHLSKLSKISEYYKRDFIGTDEEKILEESLFSLDVLARLYSDIAGFLELYGDGLSFIRADLEHILAGIGRNLNNTGKILTNWGIDTSEILVRRENELINSLVLSNLSAANDNNIQELTTETKLIVDRVVLGGSD